MGLVFHHLEDSEVRDRMVSLWREEFDQLDARCPRDQWPYGKLLTATGWDAFEEVMPQALAEHDDEWLAAQMSDISFWKPKMSRRNPKGGYMWVEYDKPDAIQRLAMGEFNTAYVHGLASVLLGRGQQECLVYRAGTAAEPRREYCTDLEGASVLVQQVFDDHRASYFPPPGNPSARPIPSGPNCHHSIRA